MNASTFAPSSPRQKWCNREALRSAKSVVYGLMLATWACAAFEQGAELFSGTSEEVVFKIARVAPQWGLALVAAIWAFSLGLVITLALQDAQRSRREQELLAKNAQDEAEDGEDDDDAGEEGLPGRWLVH